MKGVKSRPKLIMMAHIFRIIKSYIIFDSHLIYTIIDNYQRLWSVFNFSSDVFRYSKLYEDDNLKPEKKRIDFVLIYPNKVSKDEKDPRKRKTLEQQERNRSKWV